MEMLSRSNVTISATVKDSKNNDCPKPQGAAQSPKKDNDERLDGWM